MIIFGVIYCITNKINGKKYIGQTTNIKDRLTSHFIRKNKNSKTQINKAIKKYGKENFDFEIVAKAYDGQELLDLEIKYIKEYNTLQPIGYNIQNGGIISYSKTKEAREKLSKSIIGKKHGRAPAKHTIEALIAYNKSKSREEVLALAKYASDCASKKPRTLKQIETARIQGLKMIGHVKSKETCKKISESKKGKPCSNMDSQRRVEVKFINKLTGEEKVFPSVKSCAKHVGLDEASVWKRINGQIQFGRKYIRHLQFEAVNYLNWDNKRGGITTTKR